MDKETKEDVVPPMEELNEIIQMATPGVAVLKTEKMVGVEPEEKNKMKWNSRKWKWKGEEAGPLVKKAKV